MRLAPLVAACALAGCALTVPRPARPPAAGGAVVEAGDRAVRPANRDWTFTYDPAPEPDEAKAAPGLDDDAWPAVALPHTWSTFETTGEVHPFIYAPSERDDPYWWYGWGWYRKRFTPAASLAETKLFAEFDGVQKRARVYLNGALVGEHLGGYTSFSVDLTDAVRWGQENVLAVAVSNRRDDPDRVPPMTAGNFDVYGGIYRDVRLVTTGRLYVPFQGSADHEGGTFVTTPVADSARGVVRVLTHVRNEHDGPRTATVRTTVLDPDRQIVAQMESAQTVAPGETATFDQTSAEILRPRLWSPETPALYAVRTEVASGGRVVDRWESPLGFRTFHWDHDHEANKLVLNGQTVRINGTNRHQEYPWLGDAIPDWITRSDLLDIRHGLGHNFMRGTHYPNDPLVYALTDSLGIVTVEEVPNIKDIDFSEAVQEQNVREMVRRDRNHPSILFWSMGNETDDAADSRWAVEEDTTRIVHLRKGEDGGDSVTHTHQDLDLENLLRVTVRGWFTQDEVPGGVDGRPENGQHASTEAWQHATALVPDASVRGSIDRDVVLWLYADHGADREYKDAPLKHVNPKGWVDLYRVPKYVYYLWQANFTDAPMVFVQPHFWRRIYLGQRKDFVVDSNCDAVELRVDGAPIGRQLPGPGNHHSVTFEDVEVVDGTLEAVCLDDETVRHAVPMAGPPARLTLRASHAVISADRSGVAAVLADVVDAEGNTVLGAAPPLVWSVEGPGRLVGPARYEPDGDKHEAREGTMYVALPVGTVVRSTAEPGPITVRVTSPGLAGAEVVVQSVPPPAHADAGIVQPPLADAGRQPVRRDPAFAPAAALPDVVGAGRATRPLRVTETDPDARRRAVDAFVRGVSPDVDTTTAAYRAFAAELEGTLGRTGGVVVEDDYTVLAERHDDALQIERFLGQLPLPPTYRTAIRAHYTDEVVRRGTRVDAEAVRQRLARAAPGAQAVVFDADRDPEDLTWRRGLDAYLTGARTLGAAVALLEPEVARLAPEQRARALAFVLTLNPHLGAAPGADPADVALPPGQPVLVPALAVLRDL